MRSAIIIGSSIYFIGEFPLKIGTDQDRRIFFNVMALEFGTKILKVLQFCDSRELEFMELIFWCLAITHIDIAPIISSCVVGRTL